VIVLATLSWYPRDFRLPLEHEDFEE